jgi:hypothetical protein
MIIRFETIDSVWLFHTLYVMTYDTYIYIIYMIYDIWHMHTYAICPPVVKCGWKLVALLRWFSQKHPFSLWISQLAMPTGGYPIFQNRPLHERWIMETWAQNSPGTLLPGSGALPSRSRWGPDRATWKWWEYLRDPVIKIMMRSITYFQTHRQWNQRWADYF